MDVKQYEVYLVDSDGTTTTKVRLQLRLVIHKRALLESEKTILPTVYVVCPLAQSTCNLKTCYGGRLHFQCSARKTFDVKLFTLFFVASDKVWTRHLR